MLKRGKARRGKRSKGEEPRVEAVKQSGASERARKQASKQESKQAGTPFCSRYALSMGPRASSPRVLRLTRDR